MHSKQQYLAETNEDCNLKALRLVVAVVVVGGGIIPLVEKKSVVIDKNA